ncbi:hypothetical protein L596_030618 [Steinernema carpocapsae]|uniref:Ig-like domain-containing protein n=1 Tax=Steinernema carpocapsae TaxID=34508 RepID=A0A4U5LPZ5_STECR|nr:hypothetical protein L596_030618 [Steinernema carpocapsae]
MTGFPKLIALLFCAEMAYAAKVAPMCANLLDGTVLTLEDTLDNVAKPKGSTVTLKCNVFGSPQARISWFHNGTLIEEHKGPIIEEIANMRSESWLAMSIQNARLRIPCLTKAHEGVYTCRAESPCGNVVEAHYKVKMLPRIARPSACSAEVRLSPFISVFTSSRLELEGNKIQLMCRAKEPNGFVQWAVADQEGEFYHAIEKFDHFKKLPNGDLLIDTTNIKEASLSFQCSVINRYGADVVDGTIVLMTK